MSDRPIIEVSNLTVSYGESPALWDINFSIDPGQLVGIIGPNGAGKSTLLKAMLHFMKPLSGEVRFWGNRPLEAIRDKIAYIPQMQSVDWNFPITAIEVVTMGDYHERGLFKWPSRKGKGEAYHWLERLGMATYADRHISQLSGGQKQKLFIARALMQQADIFFFDEPFSGIDHTTQQQLLELFQDMRSGGKTLIIVHHDLTSIESLFDHLLILNTYLVASGSCSDVFKMDYLKKAYGHSETILGEILNLSAAKKKGLS